MTSGRPAGAPGSAPDVPVRGYVLWDVWSSFHRWLLKAIRNPFVVSFSLVQPVIWLVLFTQVFQRIATIPGFEEESYLAFFAPAVVIQAALFGATSSGIGLVEDMRIGVFNKLLVSPVNRGAMFVGKTLAEAARIAVQAAIVLALAVLLGARVEAGVAGAVAVILVAVLFALGFAGFSNIVGLRTRNTEATIIIVNFLALPLLFLSSAFLPLELLPAWIQAIAAANPVTYAVDAARALMLTGWAWDVLARSGGALIAFNVVTISLAALMLRRATEARVR